ncbi:hypothetical protein I7I53_05187 [Histoplasma capsulatum var. duboisii H88]|uniref:Uncharacterized protein n=1 Tax=Ajellomyces capsulatus (strain H88) TaxID=544711 RepID=A0A8A1LY63_AJEC8|nr:hypothetical protein I7I53_05187 [Histoplasma capsulatum var. duboisii H88]
MKLVFFMIEIFTVMMQQIIAENINSDKSIHTSSDHTSKVDNLPLLDINDNIQQHTPVLNLLNSRFRHCREVVCTYAYECLTLHCSDCIFLSTSSKGHCIPIA